MTELQNLNTFYISATTLWRANNETIRQQTHICTYMYIYIHTYIIQPFFCDVTKGECSRSVQWSASRLVPDLRDSKQVQQIFRCSRLPDNFPSTNFKNQQTAFLITHYTTWRGGETHGRMLTRESIGVHGSHHIKFKMLHLLKSSWADRNGTFPPLPRFSTKKTLQL